ncbi:unnamed protein product [Periconia digitata]|uniref:AB hydrolase-1 domain-containing protein n=1 Tax=Periconia digitata TaxID=1303443 RepID=A0A9W4UJX4_9PLEO|nr:unnamed protein product [Periconia digitata]
MFCHITLSIKSCTSIPPLSIMRLFGVSTQSIPALLAGLLLPQLAMSSLTPATKNLTVSGGFTYSYVFQPASDQKPTFLFVHGFPSGSHDWRHQIRDLSNAGYGVIAPDLLGYGGTDKPSEVEEYSVWKIASHMANILEHEEISQVIGVGHDWGCSALGMLANRYPEYLSALVFMAVPYSAPGPFDLDAINNLTEETFGYPSFGYWNFFNESDSATVLDEHVESSASITYPNEPSLWKTDLCPFGKAREWITSDKRAPLPSWLTQEESDKHISILRDGGSTGPLNWYKAGMRNIDVDKYDQIPASNLIIKQQTLFLMGQDDAASRPELAKSAAEQGKTEGYLPNVEVQELEGCGHWIQLEKPQEVFVALEGVAKKACK